MSPKAFPQLSKENESILIEKLLQWSLANGLVMYPPDYFSHSATNAPVTLFPTPFPKQSFQNAIDVQKSFNELYVNVISSKEWLLQILEELSDFDPEFTGKLFSAYKKAEKIGLSQQLSLGLFRSDYMIHQDLNDEIKQIEFNTISVSFGGLSSKTAELHTYLNKIGAYDDINANKYYEDRELPESSSITKLAEGLADGNFHYNNGVNNTKTVVLFIVQPRERNVFDQRHIEYSLLNNHGIKSYRSTLESVQEDTYVDETTKKLHIKITKDEVSVVYYRSGYSPSDYSTPETWDVRIVLESSKAIKCPSLLTQLSGAKKIQQILTVKEQILKFLPNLSAVELKKICSTFVAIYPLDNSPEGLKAKELAFQHPERFVLKPQREGGGNNIYKESIPTFLKSISEKDWAGYILMELINPPNHKNKIIRKDEVFNEEIISELGVFGTTVFNEVTGSISTNKNAGWLLRSKFSTSDEGGVAAGFGCVDSVYLF